MPWCIRKCPYCDFNSHKSPEKIPEALYINALIEDLKIDLSLFDSDRTLHSIFIGGGTPSLFSPESYEILFHKINQLISFSSSCEITMEANPGTVEQNWFSHYRDLGINRLSLGIQSFNAQHLKRLGRIHDDKQAHLAIETARKAGFDNLNLDIMHGLPHQSIMEGLEDLKTAISYQPEHLSWYQLTIEPNTLFYKQKPPLPTEDNAFLLEQQGHFLLAENNLQRYEISAFSRCNKLSQHNYNYWTYGDYLGIGAGAHGKITTKNGILRTRKCRQPKDYLDLDKPYLTESIKVKNEDILFEFMLNATRLEEKIAYSLFTDRTGLPIDTLMRPLYVAENKHLVTLEREHWQVNTLGRRYTNDLQALFLPND